MAWVFPFAAEELQIFLQEVDEQLQALEGGLLDMERGGASAELLAAVFRAAHTLKGSAGTVGHQPMTRLTHALENVLDGLRAGRLELTGDVADRLLDAVDRLAQIRSSMGAEAVEDVDVDDAVGRLDELAEGTAGRERQPTRSEGPDTPPAPPPPAAAATGGAPDDAGDPQEPGSPGSGARGQHIVVTVVFARDCPMTSVRAYQAVAAAKEHGTVTECRPNLNDIEHDRVVDRVAILVSGCEAERLAAVLRALPDVADVQVAVEPSGAAPAATRPQKTVRIDVAVLDNLLDLVGELVVDRTRLARAVGELSSDSDGRRALTEIAAHLWRTTAQLQDEVMRSRLLPVENLFRKFPRLVRDAGRQLAKQIDFVMTGQETELDRSVLEEIGDPLVHLLRNAADHGVESPEERQAAGKSPQGRVTLSAEHGDGRVVIRVQDDGAGIDPQKLVAIAVDRGVVTDEAARRMSREEALDLIFLPGFTTKSEATALSGRGVGMDVVRQNIERLNGSVTMSSELGAGTCVTISLPLTLAIVQALTVRVGDTVFALPLHAVVEAQSLDAGAYGTVKGREVVRLRDHVLPLIRGRRLLGLGADAETPLGRPLVHLLAGHQRVTLLVDALLGEQELVIKALDPRLAAMRGLSGAAVLGDGRVALILDPATLFKGIDTSAASDGGAQVA